MITIKNNFTKDEEINVVYTNSSIFKIIQENLDEEIKTGGKIKVFLNDLEINQEDFDIVPNKSDNVEILVVPGEPVSFMTLIYMVVINLVVSYIMSRLFAPDEPSKIQKNSVYDFDITQMQYSKGVVTEVFGETVVFPELISLPYSRYEDNDEVIYMTMQIARGDVSINDILLHKNSISKQLLHRDDVSLFPDKNGISWMSNRQDKMSFKKLYGENNEFKIDDEKYVYVHKLNKSFDNFDVIEFDLTPGVISLPLSILENGDLLVNCNKLLQPDINENENREVLIEKNEYYPNGHNGAITEDMNANEEYIIPDGSPFIISSLNTSNLTIDYKVASDNFKDKKWTVPTLVKRNDEIVSRVEFDVVHNNGVYRVDNEGQTHTTTVSFFVQVFKYDANNEPIIVASHNYNISDNTGFTIRKTIEMDISATYNSDELYIRVANDTKKAGTTENIANQTIIQKVKSIIELDNKIYDENVTYGIIRLSAKDGFFSQNNKLNISFRVSSSVTKLLDVVKYIWEKSGYEFSEIKEIDLLKDKNVNGQIENQASIFKQLDKILRAYRLMIVPTINGFKIKEDGVKPIRTFVFDKSNIIKNSLQITYKNESSVDEFDGFKVNYLDKNGERKSISFPNNSLHPKEANMFGKDSEEDALVHAKIGYNKMNKLGATVRFKTSLKGFIPEVEDRIGVASYLLDSQITSAKIIGNDNGKYTLDKEIFVGNKDNLEYKYCIIRSNNGTLDQELFISGRDKEWTNQIEFEDMQKEITSTHIKNQDIYLLNGSNKELIEDFVVQNIKLVEENVVEISGVLYDESVFQ